MPAPDMTKDDGVTRLARTIGAKSVREMCRMLGLSRDILARAIAGNPTARKVITKRLGEAAAKILFGEVES